jgi:hypothetical protein
MEVVSVIDIFDTANFVVGHVYNRADGLTFVLSFFHTTIEPFHIKKGPIRCVVRFAELDYGEKIYTPSYSVKSVDTAFAVTPAAEKEFGRKAVEVIKDLHRSKFLCGGECHAGTNN